MTETDVLMPDKETILHHPRRNPVKNTKNTLLYDANLDTDAGVLVPRWSSLCWGRTET